MNARALTALFCAPLVASVIVGAACTSKLAVPAVVARSGTTPPRLTVIESEGGAMFDAVVAGLQEGATAEVNVLRRVSRFYDAGLARDLARSRPDVVVVYEAGMDGDQR